MNDINLLLNNIRNGDSSAGPIVVSMYGRRLMRYIHLIAPNLSEVDREILAERTLEAALANINRFDPHMASFDTYVRGYARLKLLEHYRSHPNTVSAGDLDLDEWSPPAEDHSEEHDGLIRQIAAALRTLPATDQLIISLRDINGLSYQQIADELQVSASACRQRHKRAVESLRRAIEVQDTDAPVDSPFTRHVPEESPS